MRSFFAKVLTIVALLLCASTAKAAVYTIQAAQRGWVCDVVNTPCAVYGQPGAVQANNGASPGK